MKNSCPTTPLKWGSQAMVGKAWYQSRQIFQKFWKKPGANPNEFEEIFETAGGPLWTEVLSE